MAKQPKTTSPQQPDPAYVFTETWEDPAPPAEGPRPHPFGRTGYVEAIHGHLVAFPAWPVPEDVMAAAQNEAHARDPGPHPGPHNDHQFTPTKNAVAG